MLVRAATSAPSAPAGTCPPPGSPPPTGPQKPVPVPATPPPNWSGTVMAAATGRWWVPNDQFQVRIASTAGEQDGYGTWASAVEAAGPLSTSLGRSLGILDHEGRLYLRELDVPAWRPYLPAEAYVMGRRFETGLRFSNDAIRGIVQGDLTLGRGDCLDQWVAIPTPRAARV